ncbi:hydroperoxide isomerase ALOXE3-like [Sphaeramia orbicularis]|uniref:Hydroperoxide isomerase ALOXE3-like n=1 Tax=Sphaeramia orbicularis TaxID=375764 RepID=A0A673AD42_9TELE|nr:hydroperoxide isomerase ALOXE3-like [Sphaeramia orbicularis]
MAEYQVEVLTGDMEYAGTRDHIYVTLTGADGKSERTELDNFGLDFRTGDTATYTIKTNSSLGKLLLIKLEKEANTLLVMEDEWYCSKIVVKTPEGDAILFPCHLWMSRGEVVELRGGKATKVFEDDHPALVDHRKQELIQKKNTFQWRVLDEGIPHINHYKEVAELPAEIRFSKSKSSEILHTKIKSGIELMLKGMLGSAENWETIDDMKKIFWLKKTPMSEYVTEHWKDDDFFGSQFLNAINPKVIKRCSELPPNFPVTDKMVQPFLEKGSSLQKEMEKGNIFLYDQKMMDGISPRLQDGKPLHVTPCICLLYSNPEKKLMPIAIQLHQQPSETNPIFLPSDSETDWLLAKMFVKNADLMDHQAVHHLMNTHFLAEAYCVATHRCLPVVHPIYKLLIPHFRYTLPINTGGRLNLFGPEGALSISSLGYEGLMELMRRGLSAVTFSALCLPYNITSRGLESVPNFYFRDDGLKLWGIVNSYVKAMVEFYYPSDDDVRKDSELQDWISEIFTHGVLGKKESEFPESFSTVEELVRFLTMVVFTVTGRHAALNDGQFDYHSWVPNGSLLLMKPPPTSKGQSSMKTVMETLPNLGDTVSFAALAWVLSQTYSDTVTIGQFPEERFDEPVPKQIIKEFQAELSYLSEAISSRNSQLEVPYIYLNPNRVQNSITI